MKKSKVSKEFAQKFGRLAEILPFELYDELEIWASTLWDKAEKVGYREGRIFEHMKIWRVSNPKMSEEELRRIALVELEGKK
jgi:hypothetical protein